MEMTYEQYHLLCCNLDNVTQEEMDLFMQVESAVDMIFIFLKDETDNNFEEAVKLMIEKTGLPQNTIDLAVCSAKEQLALFKECEEKGHDFGEVASVRICHNCGYAEGSKYL